MSRLSHALSEVFRALREQRKQNRLLEQVHDLPLAPIPDHARRSVWITGIRREILIDLLPRGGVAAEIGVAKGDLSRRILRMGTTSKLHLVDPWIHQKRDDYVPDTNNVRDDEQEQRFRKVSRLVSAHVRAGTAQVHRTYSTEFAKTLAPGELDWVYVDGMHTYEGVMADLEAFSSKVKPEGFILGHDYCNHERARSMNFGVVEAVDDFTARTDWRLLVVSLEAYSTFVLTRAPDGGATARLLSNLLRVDRAVTVHPNFRGTGFRQALLGGEVGSELLVNRVA